MNINIIGWLISSGLIYWLISSGLSFVISLGLLLCIYSLSEKDTKPKVGRLLIFTLFLSLLPVLGWVVVLAYIFMAIMIWWEYINREILIHLK
jgi:hypothetical protein